MRKTLPNKKLHDPNPSHRHFIPSSTIHHIRTPISSPPNHPCVTDFNLKAQAGKQRSTKVSKFTEKILFAKSGEFVSIKLPQSSNFQNLLMIKEDKPRLIFFKNKNCSKILKLDSRIICPQINQNKSPQSNRGDGSCVNNVGKPFDNLYSQSIVDEQDIDEMDIEMDTIGMDFKNRLPSNKRKVVPQNIGYDIGLIKRMKVCSNVQNDVLEEIPKEEAICSVEICTLDSLLDSRTNLMIEKLNYVVNEDIDLGDVDCWDHEVLSCLITPNKRLANSHGGNAVTESEHNFENMMVTPGRQNSNQDAVSWDSVSQ